MFSPSCRKKHFSVVNQFECIVEILPAYCLLQASNQRCVFGALKRKHCHNNCTTASMLFLLLQLLWLFYSLTGLVGYFFPLVCFVLSKKPVRQDRTGQDREQDQLKWWGWMTAAGRPNRWMVGSNRITSDRIGSALLGSGRVIARHTYYV